MLTIRDATGSPDVKVQGEIDISEPPIEDVTDLMLVGPTERGPAFAPKEIRRQKELDNIFGSGETYTTYAATKALEETDRIKVMRVMHEKGWVDEKPLIFYAEVDQNDDLSLVSNGLDTIPNDDDDRDVESDRVILSMIVLSGDLKDKVDVEKTELFSLTQERNDPPFLRLFGMRLRNSDGDVVRRFNLSFDNYSNRYMKDVLEGIDGMKFFVNFEETQQKLLDIDSEYEVSTNWSDFSASLGNYPITPIDFEDQSYHYARTPWIVSQTLADGERYPLFRFVARGAGNSENQRFKISINGIGDFREDSEYGFFTVQIRGFTDNDFTPDILEEYQDVTLDPNHERFIKRVIGDRWEELEEDGQLVKRGRYENQSDYVRVEFDEESVRRAGEQALPFGFEGYSPPISSSYLTGGDVFLQSPNYRYEQEIGNITEYSDVQRPENVGTRISDDVHLGFDFQKEENVSWLNPVAHDFDECFFIGPSVDEGSTEYQNKCGNVESIFKDDGFHLEDAETFAEVEELKRYRDLDRDSNANPFPVEEFDDKLYVAEYTILSNTGTKPALAIYDGSSWSLERNIPMTSEIGDLETYGGGLYTSSFDGGEIFETFDGTNFTDISYLGSGARQMQTYNNHLLVTDFVDSEVYSYDGLTWTGLGFPGSSPHGIGVGNDGFLYVVTDSGVIYSYDGSVWTQRFQIGGGLTSVAPYLDGVVISDENGGVIWYYDGFEWSQINEYPGQNPQYLDTIEDVIVTADTTSYSFSWYDNDRDVWGSFSYDDPNTSFGGPKYVGTYNGDFIVTGYESTGKVHRIDAESILNGYSTESIESRKFSIGLQGGFDGANPYRDKDKASDITESNTFGFDLSDTSNQDYRSYVKAINLLSEVTGGFQFNLLSTPGLDLNNHFSLVNFIEQTVRNRGDAFYLTEVDVFNYSIGEVVERVQDVDTSYLGVYFGWLDVTKFSDFFDYVPASSFVPATYIRNDNLRDPWIAPSGNTRGVVEDVQDVFKRLSKTERDTLYENNINAVDNFSPDQVLLWGQKTQYGEDGSALTQISVRRLLATVKSEIRRIARNNLFEQISESKLRSFESEVREVLSDVRQRRGITNFDVSLQYDPDSRVDRNLIEGQISISPIDTVEYILINFVLEDNSFTFV